MSRASCDTSTKPPWNLASEAPEARPNGPLEGVDERFHALDVQVVRPWAPKLPIEMLGMAKVRVSRL